MNLKVFLKKNSLLEGDVVEVNNGQFNGTIIPSVSENILALKLDSGYNVGISLKEINSIKQTGKGKKVSKAKVQKIKQDSSLPKISILHTGGTIASRVDYRTGAVISAFQPEDMLSMFPELSKIAQIDSVFVSNMFSENMRFANHQKIARAVAKEIKKNTKLKGIIIGHGTDTITTTASMLSFMLENIQVPVILVGAQRSSDRGSTDASMNLTCAAEFISKTDFVGVGVCMHDSSSDENCAIFPANKSRKMHTSRRNAFKAINAEPIALINHKTKKISYIQKDYQIKSSAKFKLRDNFEEKVGLIKAYPNMFAEQISFFKQKKFKGLILEGTGLGHFPVGSENAENKHNLKILKAINDLTKSGCVVGMTSQCVFGRTQMHVYAAGVDLVNAGVIQCEDMLAETALVKLSWLLGNYSKKETKELLVKNLRGEIKERTKENEFEI